MIMFDKSSSTPKFYRALAALAAILVSCLSFDGTRAAHANNEQSLSVPEEAKIRDLVYNGLRITYVPREGQYKFMPLLYVPKELEDIFAKKPRLTLWLLLDIVKGGNPTDASLAAGFAYALAKSPMAGARPVTRPLSKFDVPLPDGKTTFRQQLIKEITWLIWAVDNGEGEGAIFFYNKITVPRPKP